MFIYRRGMRFGSQACRRHHRYQPPICAPQILLVLHHAERYRWTPSTRVGRRFRNARRFVPDGIAWNSRWIRRQCWQARSKPRRLSPPDRKTEIWGSDRSWNCVSGKSAGSDRYRRSPARGHRLAGVWNSSDGRKVIRFQRRPPWRYLNNTSIVR